MLLQVGMEALPSDIVPMILTSRDRKELAKFALSVPPHGLCLVAVKYKAEHLHLPADAPTSSCGRHRSIGRCKLPCSWQVCFCCVRYVIMHSPGEFVVLDSLEKRNMSIKPHLCKRATPLWQLSANKSLRFVHGVARCFFIYCLPWACSDAMLTWRHGWFWMMQFFG